jgi:hypothetical protein
VAPVRKCAVPGAGAAYDKRVASVAIVTQIVRGCNVKYVWL